MSSSVIWTDKWTLADRLGFGRYVKSLEQVIHHADTPLTIGIFGSWGSGKTSLMKMLENELQSHAITVWFDAWKYDKEDTLWRALLISVLSTVRDQELVSGNKKLEEEIDLLEESLYRDVDLEKEERVTVDLGQLTKSFSTAAVQLSLSLIPGFSVFSELIKKAQGDSSDAIKDIFSSIQRKKIEIHRDHIKFLDQFQARFAYLVSECYVKYGYSLVIFIDDLDRCLPEKAIEVLEAIKLFLDVPGCVFVLGVDRDIIEKGIKIKYGKYVSASDILSRDESELLILGSDYLEKIIQLPFFLPPLDVRNVEKYIKSLLPEAVDSVIEAFVAGIELNPRKIKRTLNTFLFLQSLAKLQPEFAQLIEDELLAKIVTVQQRYHDTLYMDIIGYPNLLIELESYFDQRYKEETIRSFTVAERIRRVENVQAFSAELESGSTLLERYASLKPLQSLLLAGRSRFGKTRVEPYIYLTRTTALEFKSPIDLPVDEKIWLDLLSNDPTKIRYAIDRIEEKDRSSYVDFLLKAIADVQQNVGLGISAGIALGYLDDPRLEQTATIPAGEFHMGTSERVAESIISILGAAHSDKIELEMPQQSINLDSFEIDIYPVTNHQYKQYVDTTHSPPPLFWEGGNYPDGTANYPVVGVSWFEATKYAQWVGKRLPTEAEWEKSARGLDAREWPWGDKFDKTYCNCRELGINKTTPVGVFPQNASPFGVYDMAGNVWEWTSSLLSPYPYNIRGSRVAEDAEGLRVLRGGSFFHDAMNSRCACRNGVLPELRNEYTGFRCCRDIIDKKE